MVVCVCAVLSLSLTEPAFPLAMKQMAIFFFFWLSIRRMSWLAMGSLYEKPIYIETPLCRMVLQIQPM